MSRPKSVRVDLRIAPESRRACPAGLRYRLYRGLEACCQDGLEEGGFDFFVDNRGVQIPKSGLA
ncbi:MAG: hypothetical protein QOJ42_6872, partial [Acidobacteriaceae bacterium]|nr:hypothetical protein [Acidobacteriaceae bacterium]